MVGGRGQHRSVFRFVEHEKHRRAARAAIAEAAAKAGNGHPLGHVFAVVPSAVFVDEVLVDVGKEGHQTSGTLHCYLLFGRFSDHSRSRRRTLSALDLFPLVWLMKAP